MRNAGSTVSGPEGYLVACAVAEDNLRIGRTVIVDAVNPFEITRNYWREAARVTAVALVELEVICSDRGEHGRRVECRAPDISGHVLPNWQQGLARRYEPWDTAHVIDTARYTLEDAVSEAEARVREADARPG